MTSPRPSTSTRVAGAVALSAALASVVWGLSLGFHLEQTEEAIYQTAVGWSLLRVVWVAVPLAAVAIVTGRPRVGIACALGAALVVGAVAVRAVLDLRPEAGERRVASAFRAPDGAVLDRARWTGYSFPSLSEAWRIPGTRDAACDAATASMRAWSESPPRRRELERSCFVSGRRDGHIGSVYVGPHPDDRRTMRLHLTITRDV